MAEEKKAEKTAKEQAAVANDAEVVEKTLKPDEESDAVEETKETVDKKPEEEKAEKPAEEKPAEEKAAKPEKPAEEKAAKPEKPAEEKAAKPEKPAEEKAAKPEKPAKEESEEEEKKVSANTEGDDGFEPIRRRKGYGAITGIVHVMATFNNTKVTVTDMKGNVIAWRSGGRCGFKGSRKSTAYAATIVAQEAAREAASKGLRECEIRLNGPGAGRESAVRAIHAARIRVTSIQDVTPIPHNGCRPPKRRRV